MNQTLQKALDQLDQASAAVRLAVHNMATAPGGADAAGDAAHALSGGVIDPFGNKWYIATHVKDM